MLKYFVIGASLTATAIFLAHNKDNTLTRDGKGVAKYLMKLGYSKSIASGIAGNLYVESKYDPMAVGDNGQSFGLAQWHKSRWDALKEWSEKRGKPISDFKTQLDFIDWELKNTENKASRLLNDTTNPHDSAFIFAKYYERPKHIREERMSKAVEIYQSL